MLSVIKTGIMAVLASVGILGCATTAKDRYEALNMISVCKASPLEIDLGNSTRIGTTPVEGRLDDSKCLILSERRTSHSSFQFIATSPTQEFEIQIFPKMRRLGFGGQHTLFLPELLVIDGVSLKSAKLESYFHETDMLHGKMHYFGFSVSDLVPGKSYYLLVTSNNSNPGSVLFSEKVAVPYYPQWSSEGPDMVPEYQLVLDASLFVGPFGDFTIKAGKNQRGKPK
jgi:hypothetical protein